MWCWHFETFIWWLIHKTARFLRSKNRKWFFGATTRKTFSCNIVRHPRMHMHAQYGHVITNYAAILAITLAIWTEKPWNLKHDSSFWEGLFEMQSIYQVWYFSLQPCHIKWRHAKDLHCSDSFWIFYASFKLWSKRRAWRFLARGWVSPNLHWISNKTAYCESKNDFCKKSWAYDNVHVVQIVPTSYRFGRNLSLSPWVDRKVWDTQVGTFVHLRWPIIF